MRSSEVTDSAKQGSETIAQRRLGNSSPTVLLRCTVPRSHLGRLPQRPPAPSPQSCRLCPVPAGIQVQSSAHSALHPPRFTPMGRFCLTVPHSISRRARKECTQLISARGRAKASVACHPKDCSAPIITERQTRSRPQEEPITFPRAGRWAENHSEVWILLSKQGHQNPSPGNSSQMNT